MTDSLEQKAREYVENEFAKFCINGRSLTFDRYALEVVLKEFAASVREQTVEEMREAIRGLVYLTDQEREGGLILSRYDHKPLTNADQEIIDRAYIAAEAAIKKSELVAPTSSPAQPDAATLAAELKAFAEILRILTASHTTGEGK